MHAEHHGSARDDREWREVLECVVGHPGARGRADHELVVRHQDGVAVGRRFRHRLRRDRAAGAPAILRHERLAEALGEALREHAGEHVGAAARRCGNHHAHGPVRILLRMRRRDEREREKQKITYEVQNYLPPESWRSL
jgi:hypothetical protein